MNLLISIIISVQLIIPINQLTEQEPNTTYVEDNLEFETISNEIFNEIHFPQYNIPLSDDLKQYIWELSDSYQISYELILSIIHTESDFQIDVTSQTNDVGLMQINKKTSIWIADELDLDVYDLTDGETNVLFGVWYLDFLNRYWGSENLSEEEKYFYVIVGYNRGIQGSINWVKEHGFDNNYFKKVHEYKTKLEKQLGD